MNIHKSSNLYVISAPSGAGKTSLVRELCKRVAFIRSSISYTTRKIRESEIDGKDYFFTDTKHFESMISKDQFIEYQYVYGNLYGSTKESVLNQLDEGHDVILEIDNNEITQGTGAYDSYVSMIDRQNIDTYRIKVLRNEEIKTIKHIPKKSKSN